MFATKNVTQQVCLVVIDGWGVSQKKEGNAILNANTPTMDRLVASNSVELEAHGEHVGLPKGFMGNSEVGHLNLGAGRIVPQDILRISEAMQGDDFSNKNEVLLAAFENAKAKTGRLHLLGLVSDGGVHSYIDHLYGLLEVAKHHKVSHCYVHFFSDGRDTSPTSGADFAQQVLHHLKKHGYGELATVVGRHYAMDRDKRWERIQVAYEALIAGKGDAVKPDDLVETMKKRYESDETDEFLKPIIVSADGRIQDEDTLIFINFRSDRMREIVETMGMKQQFKTNVKQPKDLHIVCMTEYNKDFSFPVLFPAQSHKNVLADYLASQGIAQFHCAETEKYAHVTFFFNGGREEPFEKEDREMIASPKVTTYDQQPEMSCAKVADKVVNVLKHKKHAFVMCNFAPPDMVGHTGNFEAAIKACEATDRVIGQIEEACKENDFLLMVTADHGNAECMKDDKGEKVTKHTCNKVPFASTSERKLHGLKERPAALCDVAPTVLFEMGLEIPSEMTGKSLQQ